MIYLAILALLMFLSFRYDICGKKDNKEQWYFIVLCVFILFAGLRWRVGVDTMRYLYFFYHDYPTLSDFSFEEYYIGKDPFFVLLNSFVKSIGGRFYVVQLIQAAFVNTLILNYFKKHCQYIFTCCMFYFLLSYISFSMEIMRASFSIVICLYAFDYFIEKKWIKGYALLLVATMFHAQALVVFLFPAFLFLRLNKRGLTILAGAYVLGIFVQEMLGNYIFLFEGNEDIKNKVSIYTSEDDPFGKNTHNINYYIVSIIPKVFYPLFTLWNVKKYYKNSDLERLEPLVILGVIFVLIQANFVIAYRYVEYFTIYYALLYAEICVGMIKKGKNNIGFAYLRTILFFFPVMLSLVYFTAFKDPRYIYSSVLGKTIYPQKEAYFKELSFSDTYYSPNYNEY